jgi:hypothetical protein
LPQTCEEWEISEGFNDLWDYPKCMGSIDEKHVALQSPLHSGSEFYNYKGFYSIVLFAISDVRYNLLYINVGCQGRISDGGVFNQTNFKEMLPNCKLNLQKETPLPTREKLVPHVFVADDAFPLSYNIMKPFPGVQDKG